MLRKSHNDPDARVACSTKDENYISQDIGLLLSIRRIKDLLGIGEDMIMDDILITDASIVTCDGNHSIIENGVMAGQ